MPCRHGGRDAVDEDEVRRTVLSGQARAPYEPGCLANLRIVGFYCERIAIEVSLLVAECKYKSLAV